MLIALVSADGRFLGCFRSDSHSVEDAPRLICCGCLRAHAQGWVNGVAQVLGQVVDAHGQPGLLKQFRALTQPACLSLFAPGLRFASLHIRKQRFGALVGIEGFIKLFAIFPNLNTVWRAIDDISEVEVLGLRKWADAMFV